MNPHGDPGQPGTAGERYRFDGIVVDGSAHSLSRDGTPLAVEPKAFAVLLLLLRRAGALVSRDDLLDEVWGHRHVTPGVLTRVIAQLRHALDDHAQAPRYIQTMHALGYRFVGQLEGEPVAVPDASVASATMSATPAGGRTDALAIEAAVATPPAIPTASAAPPAGRVAAMRALPRRWWRRRPRGLATAAALLGFVMVAIGALVLLDRNPVPARPAGASIAVLPFTSLSSERDDSYFAEGLAVEMHDALAGVRGLKVAAQPVGVAGQHAPDVKALGKTLGVATVLAASVRRDGARVRISARLSDTGTGFTLWSKSYDREASDVFALQTEIASQVVQSLLGVLPADPGLARRLAPTGDVAAYDAYLKGLQQLQHGSNGNGDGPAKAIQSFGQALAADRGFARAQAGICRAEIARFEDARDPAAFARAQAACERATGMDPGLREVSLALGELHRARGATDQAVAQYTRALDDVSLRPAAYIGLARTYSALGENQLALDYFRRARELRPGDSAIYRELGYHQYLNDDVPGAIESFHAAATLHPDDAGPWSSLGGLYLVDGDLDLAADAFRRSLAIEPSYAALSNLGTLKFSVGAYAEAATLYRRAAELDPDDYRVWGNIGDALAALPATAAQAGDLYRRAAGMAMRYVGIKTDDAQALALLAWYRANLGEQQAARQALARAEALATERGEVAFFGAQTLALLGELEQARARVREARAQDIPLQRLQASPVLRRLKLVDAAATPAASEPAGP